MIKTQSREESVQSLLDPCEQPGACISSWPEPLEARACPGVGAASFPHASLAIWAVLAAAT